MPLAVPAEMLVPSAWVFSTKNCPHASGRKPHDERLRYEPETGAPELPGLSTLYTPSAQPRGPRVIEEVTSSPTTSPLHSSPKPADERAPCQVHITR